MGKYIYISALLKIIKGTAYLVYHTCNTLCMLYASRRVYKLSKTSWLNNLYGEDNI